MKHTKGEWHDVAGVEIRSQAGLLLATTYKHLEANQSKEEREANAKLMAAAPELLEALKTIIDRLEEYPDLCRGYSDDEKKWLEIGKEAIKKLTI